MNTPLRFRIKTAAGEVHVGPVHGCGGLISGDPARQLHRLRLQVERAEAGDPLHIAADDLRGAKVTLA